jgi:WD40 repeat protein
LPLIFKSPRTQVPAELELPEWVIDRPQEAGQVVSALLGRGGKTVAITTGLHGAGGFGKTTLAQIVCADHRVRQRFRGGVYPITIGRDIRGAAAMAAKVNDVIKLISGEEATFTDPEIAGNRLGMLLEAGPRRLLVIDDVWEAEQLAPFTSGARRCARLVTTRVPGLLGARTQAVLVDQMSVEQARKLLMAELPPLDQMIAGGLLAVTGRWPLLLRLVNKILANAAGSGADVRAAGAQLLERLRTAGPAVVDDLLGEDSKTLRVGMPAERARAVRATIGASTSLLSPEDAQRFTELGVFAEDEIVPFSLVAQLWNVTAGFDDLRATRLCSRLNELALVSMPSDPARLRGLLLHDVVRDFLRGEMEPDQLAALNGQLLNAIAADLPADTANGTTYKSAKVMWWKLGSDDRYMWEHLIEHLLDAGRKAEAEDLAGDLRWVGARLLKSGPAGPVADLTLVGTPTAVRRRTALTRAAHLLAPTEPTEAVVDVLHSRVADDPEWERQVSALRKLPDRPRLVNRWPLPDIPHSALRRVLTGHDGSIDVLAIAPDDSWLATGDHGGTVRIWDTATGRARATLTGHRGHRVMTMAISPDSSWLATGGTDGVARIWDAVTGQEQIPLTGHHGRVAGIDISRDGTRLATVDESGVGVAGRVRIWDAITWQLRTTITGHRGHQIVSVAIAPDGRWLATGSTNGEAQIWDAATGRLRATLAGHRGRVSAVAISPDGNWLATSDTDLVRIWDAVTGQARASLPAHHGRVSALVIAPDSSWLATISDGRPRMWNASTGQAIGTSGDRRNLSAKAMAVTPDGSWVATGGTDGMVRIFDAATMTERAVLAGHNRGVTAVAVAGGGRWLATGDEGGTVRIWNIAVGQHRASSPPRSRVPTAMRAAPDGDWLATIGDNSLQIWDAATGLERAVIINTDERGKACEITTVTIARDGRWLATCDKENVVRLRETATGQLRATIESSKYGNRRKITAMAISLDSSWLATGDSESTVRVWDSATGIQREEFTVRPALGSNARISGIAIAPDGTWLAAREASGNVAIWDTSKRHMRTMIAGHRSEGIMVAPDSRWLAFDSGGVVRIFDAYTGNLRNTLALRNRAIHTAAIAPDGGWLITTDNRGPVRIWDPISGRERAVIGAHRGQVGVAAISPDGSWLATTEEGTMRICDPSSGREGAVLANQHGHINAAAASPDGNWLATTEEGTMRVWDPATGRVQALMRVDHAFSAFSWLGTTGIAAASWAGLYVFDLLADPPNRSTTAFRQRIR